MGKREELGDFVLNLTSVRIEPGLSGNIIVHSNWEGTALHFGTVFQTGILVGGKNGTFTLYAVMYLEDGTRLTATATGLYQTIRPNVWETQASVSISDGSKIVTEGTLDLAARSWVGKYFEPD